MVSSYIVTRSKLASKQTGAYMKTEKSPLDMYGKGFCATRAQMNSIVSRLHESHLNFAPSN